MTHPAFIANPSAIRGAHQFLSQIHHIKQTLKLDNIQFSSVKIQNIYSNYSTTYAEYNYALVDLDLLIMIEDSISTWKSLQTGQKPQCNHFNLTNLAVELLLDSSNQYFRMINTDTIIMNKVKRSIAKRKVMTKSYDNQVHDYIYDLLINTNYEYADADNLLNKSLWSNESKLNVTTYLSDFKSKTFEELVTNREDGRIYHSVINLKSGARPILKYKNLKYVGVLDIRSCYPTFFSSYMLDLNCNKISSSILLLTVTGKGTETYNKSLQEEHKKWIEFFTNPDIDPKSEIKRICGYEDTNKSKSAMIECLNGSSKYPEYFQWMSVEFPLLYSIWMNLTDEEKKKTGNAIGKAYESRLILNLEVFRIATTMNLKLAPEHDGYGIFSELEWNDNELKIKLDYIKKFMQDYAVKHFGVPVIIKDKETRNVATVDYMEEMSVKWTNYNKEKNELQPRVDKARRKMFVQANRGNPAIEMVYYELKYKLANLQERYKEVINYHKAIPQL